MKHMPVGRCKTVRGRESMGRGGGLVCPRLRPEAAPVPEGQSDDLRGTGRSHMDDTVRIQDRSRAVDHRYPGPLLLWISGTSV